MAAFVKYVFVLQPALAILDVVDREAELQADVHEEVTASNEAKLHRANFYVVLLQTELKTRPVR